MHKQLQLLFFGLCSPLCVFLLESEAADCTDVDGITITIAANCENLSIGGNGSNVIINSGVVIHDDTGNAANTTLSSSNTIITNNGTISSDASRAFRTNGGDVHELINNGTISAGTNEAIRSNSNITTLTNTGTISAVNKLAIHNRPSGTIGTLTNSGTISAGNEDAIQNQGSIGTFTNTGTISSGNNFFDITSNHNNSSIGTLNNSQGESANYPVTFSG